MVGIDIFYLKLAILCCLVGLFFFFVSSESILRGKLSLPSWVFAAFSLVIGVFFFRTFVDSVNEFNIGRHDSLDQLIDTWQLVVHYANFLF
jgi:hypothetical protein